MHTYTHICTHTCTHRNTQYAHCNDQCALDTLLPLTAPICHGITASQEMDNRVWTHSSTILEFVFIEFIGLAIWSCILKLQYEIVQYLCNTVDRWSLTVYVFCGSHVRFIILLHGLHKLILVKFHSGHLTMSLRALLGIFFWKGVGYIRFGNSMTVQTWSNALSRLLLCDIVKYDSGPVEMFYNVFFLKLVWCNSILKTLCWVNVINSSTSVLSLKQINASPILDKLKQTNKKKPKHLFIGLLVSDNICQGHVYLHI